MPAKKLLKVCVRIKDGVQFGWNPKRAKRPEMEVAYVQDGVIVSFERTRQAASNAGMGVPDNARPDLTPAAEAAAMADADKSTGQADTKAPAPRGTAPNVDKMKVAELDEYADTTFNVVLTGTKADRAAQVKQLIQDSGV